MIRITTALALVLALTACKGDAPSASKEVSPDGYAYTLIHMGGIDDVAIEIAWPSDWAYRDDVNLATPYVGTQVILSGGAEGYPAAEVGERFADMESEAYLTARTTDHIYGELLYLKEHSDETMQIANAHLRAPAMDQLWIDRASNELGQNLTASLAQPANRGFEAVRWAVLGDQPLRRSQDAGGPESVKAVTRADILDWMQAVLTSQPEAITVTGDVTAAEAGKALDTLLEGLPAPDHEVSRPVTADFSPRRILLHIPEAETTQLGFVGQLPPSREGGEFEDMILANALGGSDQSVLFEAVRSQLRASYGFGTGIANYNRDLRIFVMTGAVEADKLAESETVLREAYAGFVADGLSGDLSDHKAPFLASVEENIGYVDSNGLAELENTLDGGETGRVLRMKAEVEAITTQSITDRLQSAFPAPDQLITIAVSPDRDALPGACVIETPAEVMDCP